MKNNMNQENNAPFGALIERGVITATSDDGYSVESFDRKGVITPPITGISQETYSAGDRVFFFLFNDGHGKILAKLNE